MAKAKYNAAILADQQVNYAIFHLYVTVGEYLDGHAVKKSDFLASVPIWLSPERKKGRSLKTE
jgi:hypothetical protein